MALLRPPSTRWNPAFIREWFSSQEEYVEWDEAYSDTSIDGTFQLGDLAEAIFDALSVSFFRTGQVH
jgi:hypothetical protein